MRKLDKHTLQLIEKEVEDGYISKRKHPTYDIFVYKYTKACQYEQHWNEATIMARGLVLDTEGNIIALPMQKFFNYEELPSAESQKIMKQPYRVYEKVDGSLGILVKYNDEIFFTTQGSFDSEQALWATKHLHENHEDLLDKLDLDTYTYMFEIIYPENKIIVDYGNFKGLVFLAMRNKLTGEDMILQNNIEEKIFPISCPIRYRQLENTDYRNIKELNWDNAEGFVIHSKEGRLKIKFEKYIELAKIKTYSDEQHLLKALLENNNTATLDERALSIRQKLPEELLTWYDGKISSYKKQIEDTLDELIEEASYIKFLAGKDATQKQIAEINLERNDKKTAGLIFSLLNGKDIREKLFEIIAKTWKQTNH